MYETIHSSPDSNDHDTITGGLHAGSAKCRFQNEDGESHGIRRSIQQAQLLVCCKPATNFDEPSKTSQDPRPMHLPKS